MERKKEEKLTRNSKVKALKLICSKGNLVASLKENWI